MKISTFFRHIREGGRNVVRNGWMTFASISAIAISLFILGVFLLLAVNVNYMAQQIEKQVEIRVYLDVNVPEDTVTKLRGLLQAMDNVESVTFVSKEEGLKQLRERMGESGKAYLEGMDGENNPLNDAFVIEVKDPHLVSEVAAKVSKLNEGRNPKPILEVKYGQGTVETLFSVTRIVRNVGLVLVGCLAFTAMFLISNTIKLTIMARNREIKIMKLVGATNNFIRWPFFIEGALLGFIGSIIPAGLLTYGYWYLIGASRENLETFMIKLKPFEDIYMSLDLLLLLIGVVIGIWGSTLSVRKFLKV